MCGRYTQRHSITEIGEALGATVRGLEYRPSFNVAPTQRVIICRSDEGQRALAEAKWGLIPSWADDAKIGYSMINARADTVATKPAFRTAFKKRRCLIPADGFYEWKKLDAKTKQPYHFTLKDGGIFAIAGLWEVWSKGPEPVTSCTIITTEPNELTAEVHDRMPVILPAEEWPLWLDPEFEGREKLLAMLQPFPAGKMKATAVSSTVNSPKNNGPECVVEMS